MSTDLLASPTRPSKLPKIAAIVALLLAAGSLLLAIFEPVSGALGAIVPGCAGIGLMRKRVWAAYGYALALGSEGILALALSQGSAKLQLIITAMFAFAMAVLFLFAGRSLVRSGAQPGHALPWILLSCLLTLPFIFVRAFVIPTGSMENTLLIGDHILVRVFPHATPRRSELIAFRMPIGGRETIVKRVIGVPGDRIRIVDKVLYVNGAVLEEPYVVHNRQDMDAYRDNFPSDPAGAPPAYAETAYGMLVDHVANGELVVPAGKYFLLGDKRDNSLDSRYFGLVDYADIIGKAILIYGSDKDNSPGHVRWDRIGRIL